MTTYSNPPIPKLPGYVVSLPVRARPAVSRSSCPPLCVLVESVCFMSVLSWLKWCPRTLPLPSQQSLGDKRLAKNQTLGYINGYQREDALREVKDLPPRDASGTATFSNGTLQSPEAAATGTLSPSKFTGTFADSPSKLPQWVENDRKVWFGDSSDLDAPTELCALACYRSSSLLLFPPCWSLLVCPSLSWLRSCASLAISKKVSWRAT